MVPAVGADDGTHFVLSQAKCGFLKSLLHLSMAKKPEITVLPEGAAVTPFGRVLCKGFNDSLGFDLGLVGLQLNKCILGGKGHFLSGSSTDWVAAASVLYQ